jgi:hypothetical protein
MKTVMKLAMASLLAVAVAGSASADVPSQKDCPGFAGWSDWVVYFLLPNSLLPGAWVRETCSA